MYTRRWKFSICRHCTTTKAAVCAQSAIPFLSRPGGRSSTVSSPAELITAMPIYMAYRVFYWDAYKLSSMQLPDSSLMLENVNTWRRYLRTCIGCLWRSEFLYKIGILTFQCVRGIGPEYLVEMFTRVSDVVGRASLRSAVRGNIVIPRDEHCNIWSTEFSCLRSNFWEQITPWYEGSKHLISTI